MSVQYRLGFLFLLALRFAEPSIAQGFTLQHPGGPFKYTNPCFDPIIDGAFSGGLANGQPVGEWQGISALVYDTRPGGVFGKAVPISWTPGDARGRVYAPVGLGDETSLDEFYGLLAFVDYTQADWSAVGLGSTIAEVHFEGDSPGTLTLLRGNDSNLFSFYFSLENVIDSGADASTFGIEATASFSPSPLSDQPHLVIEYSIPLSVPAGFGDLNGNGEFDPDESFPPAALTGLVAPGLQRLTASYYVNRLPVPAVDMLVSYDPHGLTTLSANHLFVPEPYACGLLTMALFAVAPVGRRSPR